MYTPGTPNGVFDPTYFTVDPHTGIMSNPMTGSIINPATGVPFEQYATSFQNASTAGNIMVDETVVSQTMMTPTGETVTAPPGFSFVQVASHPQSFPHPMNAFPMNPMPSPPVSLPYYPTPPHTPVQNIPHAYYNDYNGYFPYPFDSTDSSGLLHSYEPEYEQTSSSFDSDTLDKEEISDIVIRALEKRKRKRRRKRDRKNTAGEKRKLIENLFDELEQKFRRHGAFVDKRKEDGSGATFRIVCRTVQELQKLRNMTQDVIEATDVVEYSHHILYRDFNNKKGITIYIKIKDIAKTNLVMEILNSYNLKGKVLDPHTLPSAKHRKKEELGRSTDTFEICSRTSADIVKQSTSSQSNSKSDCSGPSPSESCTNLCTEKTIEELETQLRKCSA